MRKTAGKKDDYTRLQHLNSLFMVIGSVSTAEETMQLQCTLSFMRQNDEGGVMSAKSFEHCIDQVVRFHFPNKRNLQYAHWNARKSTLDPLWVRASALSFVESVDRSSMRGLLLVSGLRESLRRGKKRWTVKCEQEYLETRDFIENLILRNSRKEQDLSVLFF
ncbi:MAG: hypothetical protein VW643_01220 [Opitutales bacterium]